ncbi:MAG: glycosyltransferase [Candidatus Woesearchaeota archaeon]|nr:glycosyltransferase [candidate division KSB1 bacterium]
MIIVAHTIHPYLFKTGTWIYNQLINDVDIKHVVLTTKTENLDKFPFQPIYSTEDLTKINEFIQKASRRLLKQCISYWVKSSKKEGVNILHSHFGNIGVENMSLAKKLNVPHVVSFYGADFGKVIYHNSKFLNQYKKLFESVSGVFVEGLYSKKTVINLGCQEEKVYVSHLGVNLASINAIQRCWNGLDPFKILIVGTFTKKKGIIISLKAIELLIRKHPDIKIEVSLVGDATNSVESFQTKKEIFEFIERSPLQKIVKKYGFLSYRKLIEISYQHHLFMQLSIFGDDGDCEGGFPVILTDMMATGMPVIGSDHCDIPEIIKHEKNGLIVSQNNIIQAKKALYNTILNYNLYASNWYKFNKDYLKQNFDAQSQAQARKEIYNKILNISHK